MDPDRRGYSNRCCKNHGRDNDFASCGKFLVVDPGDLGILDFARWFGALRLHRKALLADADDEPLDIDVIVQRYAHALTHAARHDLCFHRRRIGGLLCSKGEVVARQKGN